MLESFIYNPIALVFLSYGVGALGTGLIKNSAWEERWSNHNYISDQLTKRLGVLHFQWLIRHSFMGWFNKNLVYSGKAKTDTLQHLKREMTYAEIGHAIGFLLLLILCIALLFFDIDRWYIGLLCLINIIFNGYLVVLQQYNKRRINRLLKRSS